MMMRTTALPLTLIGLVACAPATPPRTPSNEFPGAIIDTGYRAEVNDCDKVNFGFEASSTGYLTDGYSGFGTYEYVSFPEALTTVTLRGCDPGPSPEFITLTYFGVGRVDVGTYPVSMTANTDGEAFLFSFSNVAEGTLANCSELASGEVTIESSSADEVTGSFTVSVGCRDLANLVGSLPGETQFTGTFSTNNIGLE